MDDFEENQINCVIYSHTLFVGTLIDFANNSYNQITMVNKTEFIPKVRDDGFILYAKEIFPDSMIPAKIQQMVFNQDHIFNPCSYKKNKGVDGWWHKHFKETMEMKIYNHKLRNNRQYSNSLYNGRVRNGSNLIISKDINILSNSYNVKETQSCNYLYHDFELSAVVYNRCGNGKVGCLSGVFAYLQTLDNDILFLDYFKHLDVHEFIYENV